MGGVDARDLRRRRGGGGDRRPARAGQPEARPRRARARALRLAARRDRRRAGRLPGAPRGLAVDVGARGGELPETDAGEEDAALVIYTSGTTGKPKGAILPRRAVASNLDGLAEAWQWTGDDILTHGLPLFHVHGLVLGLLGPLRRGGELRHLGRFDPAAAAKALRDGATMLFGVPTMYHRLGREAESDSTIVDGLKQARLLVSGSAPLPAPEFTRIETLTGSRSSSATGSPRR